MSQTSPSNLNRQLELTLQRQQDYAILFWIRCRNNASLLTPYIDTDSHGPNYSRPPPDLISGEAEYEVEQIRGHRHHGRRRQLQYLLKWKGYPESDNTWEPA